MKLLFYGLSIKLKGVNELIISCCKSFFKNKFSGKSASTYSQSSSQPKKSQRSTQRREESKENIPPTPVTSTQSTDPSEPTQSTSRITCTRREHFETTLNDLFVENMPREVLNFPLPDN